MAIFGDPEALAAEVIRHAQQKAVEVAEEARRRAEGILARAEKQEESLRHIQEEAIQRELATRERRNISRAELDARRRFLQLREVPIERVWRAAEEQLRNLTKQPNYREVLKLCAMFAARELGVTELTLAADAVGHELLSSDALEQWSLQAGCSFTRARQPIDAWGGLLATTGRLRFDATFPTQLERARTTLRESVFHTLSEGNP
jgi:vacuolar-type H+-ATPase subunit E/Vma4